MEPGLRARVGLRSSADECADERVLSPPNQLMHACVLAFIMRDTAVVAQESRVMAALTFSGSANEDSVHRRDRTRRTNFKYCDSVIACFWGEPCVVERDTGAFFDVRYWLINRLGAWVVEPFVVAKVLNHQAVQNQINHVHRWIFTEILAP